jgi:hypothetical protein
VCLRVSSLLFLKEARYRRCMRGEEREDRNFSTCRMLQPPVPGIRGIPRRTSVLEMQLGTIAFSTV